MAVAWVQPDVHFISGNLRPYVIIDFVGQNAVRLYMWIPVKADLVIRSGKDSGHEVDQSRSADLFGVAIHRQRANAYWPGQKAADPSIEYRLGDRRQ